MYNKFRLMLESTADSNKIPIINAGIMNLEQIVNVGLQLNKQPVPANYKQLFIPVTNDEIFKKYGIILESITYSAKLIGQINSCAEKSFCPQQIPATNLFYATNKQFQNTYKIVKNLPIYIIKYNFKTQTKYIYNLFQSFNISLDITYTHALKTLQLFNNTEGIVLPNTNTLFLLLNTQSYTIDTICHQLFHCLQIICDIQQPIKNLTTQDLIDIPELNLTAEILQHYLTPKELETYIKVDFFNQCKNIYNEYYSNKTIYKNFIYNILKTIKQNPYQAQNSYFAGCLKYKQNVFNRDLTPITIIAACFILNNKSYLDYIAQLIVEEIGG